MKKYSKCLLCIYVFGRKCKKTDELIEDDIYNNIRECNNFKSLNDEALDCDDSCCSESSRYNSLFK